MKDLVKAVRVADKEHLRIASMHHTVEGAEQAAWTAKQAARRALRDTVYETTGVNIDQLHSLCAG